MVDAELRAEFAPSTPPRSYRVVPKTDALQKELLAAQNIEAIDRTIEGFVLDLRSALGDLELDPRTFDRAPDDVPSELQDDFDRTPAAVARLLRGWTYANQAAFHVEPNVSQFLIGDLPNWSLVAARIPFERDIEESAFDGLIDFATSQDERARALIVLGSAGYGVSTILMKLAFRLITERAGRVYFHRRGLPVNEGDVLFAVESSPVPVFFVVDNAADEADRLATEVVTDGLRRVRNREGLYIALASIEKFLGNRPQSIEQLQRAVAASPGSVVARYLLGRELRRSGRAEEAVEILHELLQAHPEEVGAAIHYALALEDVGRSYSESIAALRLATLYGVRSPRFVAVLGGMLFMNQEFSEAEAVWRQAATQNFTFGEKSMVGYRPDSREDRRRPVLLEGEVSTVKVGFAFISVPGFPDIFCPGSKFGDLVMQRGLRVRFRLGFTVRGPIAVDPTAVE